MFRYRKGLFGLLALLYLLGFNGQWLVGPDSALYLVLGKNLALGRGYTYQGVPHALAYPGLPLILAGCFGIFGSHAIAAADLFVLGCGAAVIALSYRLFSLALDKADAIVITLGVGISHELYRYCHEVLTDVPFAAGVMAMLAGHEAIFHANAPRKTRWWDWALLLGGLAFVVCTRPTMLGLLAAWMGAMIWSALRGRAPWRLIVAGGVAVVLAMALFVCLDPRGVFGRGGYGYEQWAIFGLMSNFGQRLSHEVLDNVKDLFGLSAARAVFGIRLGPWWMNAVFGGVILFAGLAWMRIRPLWGLWVAATILMVTLVMSHDRYMLEILPLLVAGWWQTLKTVNMRLGPVAGNWAFALLLPLGIVPNVVKDGAMIRDQHRRPFLAYYKEGRYPAYLDMAGQIIKWASPGDLVFCPEKMSRIMTYWTDRHVLEEGDLIGATLNPSPLILMDGTDAQFCQWLASEHIVADGRILASVDRGAEKPPLMLVQGRQE